MEINKNMQSFEAGYIYSIFWLSDGVEMSKTVNEIFFLAGKMYFIFWSN
jgi:hypothetical protein